MLNRWKSLLSPSNYKIKSFITMGNSLQISKSWFPDLLDFHNNTNEKEKNVVIKWNEILSLFIYFFKKYFFLFFFIMLMKHFNSLFSSSFLLLLLMNYFLLYKNIFEEYNNIHIFFVHFRVVLWPKFRFALNLKTDGIRVLVKMRFKLNVVWDLLSNLFLFFACDEKMALKGFELKMYVNMVNYVAWMIFSRNWRCL